MMSGCYVCSGKFKEDFMLSICGLNCCDECDKKMDCGGCITTEGRPFGGRCIAAEYIKKGKLDCFLNFKNDLIDDFNSLGIKNLHISDLNLLNGYFINLEFTLPNGQSVKLLEDNNIYLGNQVVIEGTKRCYGLAADDNYLLVCEYGCGGSNPQIIVFKKR